MKRFKIIWSKDKTFIVFVVISTVYYTIEVIRPWYHLTNIHLLLIHTFFIFNSILAVQLVWIKKLRSEVAIGFWLLGFSLTIIGLLLMASSKYDTIFVYVSLLFLLYTVADLLVKSVDEYNLYYGAKKGQETGTAINSADKDPS